MLEGYRRRIAESLVAPEIRDAGITEGMAYFREAAPAEAGEEVVCQSPVFILSAGWRSGSTLLQRLVCSDGRTLIWGEPYGDRVPVCRLASTLAGFNAGDPHLDYTLDKFSGDLSRQWVANLNPGVRSLRDAHLTYLERLFAAPAQAAGASRWGAKWVRLTSAHAAYLKWLYPAAKVLLLVRHPLEAYRSYKRKQWFTVRPGHRVTGVMRFMAHWTYVADSFLRQCPSVGGVVLRYEDLTGHDAGVVDRLEEYLGGPVRRETLVEKVGGRDKEALRISLYDRAVCAAIAGPVMRKLGYSVQVGRAEQVSSLPVEAAARKTLRVDPVC